jgi:hypothetical protein
LIQNTIEYPRTTGQQQKYSLNIMGILDGEERDRNRRKKICSAED